MAKKHMRVNPAQVSEQRFKINTIREALEAAPIALSEGAFQCNERSLTRIRLTLESWGATSLTMTADGRQMWPDVENNTHLFTEPQFADFFSRMKAALAARADRLFVLANQHKAQLPLDDSHPVFDQGSSLWESAL